MCLQNETETESVIIVRENVMLFVILHNCADTLKCLEINKTSSTCMVHVQMYVTPCLPTT